MPALPDAPGALRMEFFFLVSEDIHAKCRYFLKYTGPAPSSADLVTLCQSANAAWVSNSLPAFMTTDSEYLGAKATDLTSPTSAVGEDLQTHNGTDTSGPLPGSAAVVESQTITRRSRGGHPRVYWPLGGFDHLHDRQTWDSTFIANTKTALDGFRAGVRAGNWAGATLADAAVSYYFGNTVHMGTTGRAHNIPTVRSVPIIDLVVGTIVREGVGQVRKRLLGLA